MPDCCCKIYERKQRLLTVDKMGVSFGSNVVLRDITLCVDDLVQPDVITGQIVSVLGPSGIGKTQLFRCLAGLIKPTTGQVTLNGSAKPVIAGEVGVVAQNYPLIPNRTVWGNLKLAARENVSDKDIETQLDRFGLLDKKNAYPAELSGGQRQRIAIIQQVLCSTHFILMDEPFSGLDISAKSEVGDMILELGREDELNTIIITTHDINMALRLSDTVWILGFERDVEGKRIPGATCIKQFDLIERGIAWNRDAWESERFRAVYNEIFDLFPKIRK
jgi:ABC-type nitrate/sulfonate/bicarbonate transport system ATPase subunit